MPGQARPRSSWDSLSGGSWVRRVDFHQLFRSEDAPAACCEAAKEGLVLWWRSGCAEPGPEALTGVSGGITLLTRGGGGCQ